MTPRGVLLLGIALLAALMAGCLQAPAPPAAGYHVNGSGVLSLTCPPCQASETVLQETSEYTLSHIVFHGSQGDVYAIAASPPRPRAGFLMAPGAGVKKEGHQPRALDYARQGYVFLVLDVRGNGGETSGRPLDLQDDFQRFRAGTWPEYYLSVCDFSCARSYLAARYGIPVYALGESNGGRYAAIAAALDPGFAGFFGVSTSGFGMAGNQYSGDAGRFLLSVDPETYGAMMAGRPSWIFHSREDPVIPYEQGLALYDSLAGPKQFISFNGTHGMNEEVDARILHDCGQIYALAG